jgi:hypothetical protein
VGGIALLAAMAVATPAGLLAYSAVGTDIYQPKFLLVALPAAALLIATALLAPDARLRPVLVVAGMLAFAVGGLSTTLDRDNRRPPFRAAADYAESRAGARDAVAEVPLVLARTAIRRQFVVNLDSDVRLFTALPVRLPDGTYVAQLPPEAWATVDGGGRLFVVVPRTPAGFVPPLPPPRSRARVAERREFAGFVPLAVYTFAGAP